MKTTVALIFGGKSVEHEISVISALQALLSFNTEKYNVIPVYITKENVMYTGENLKDIDNFKDIPTLLNTCEKISFKTNGEKTFISVNSAKSGLFNKNASREIEIDVAFPVVHGTNVEDGTLQGFLKTLNLPFVGCDVLSSAVCMDKYVMKVMLKNAGVPVVDGCRFRSQNDIITAIEDNFEYPVIVKPVNLGSSIGIGKANNKAELEDAVSVGFSFADAVLVEKLVQNLKEINVSVLGDEQEAEASECEEPIATEDFLTFEDKYKSSGGVKGMASLKRKIPADIPLDLREKIRNVAVAAFKELGCNGVARIDFLLDTSQNKFWLNEINTIPGSLSFYLWEPVGVSYAELIDKMISLALKRRRKENSINYSFDANILTGGNIFGTKGKK